MDEELDLASVHGLLKSSDVKCVCLSQLSSANWDQLVFSKAHAVNHKEFQVTLR